MLEGLGLAASTELVYRAMLREPGAGVSGLLAQLRLPESQVRAALDDLARLSLLRPSWDDPAVLLPVSPEIGLAALLSKEQMELATRQREIEASRSAVAVLVADYGDQRPRTPDPDAEQLIGVDAIWGRLAELARGARVEVLSMMPGGAQPAAGLAASRPLDADALGRKVTMRRVYLDSARNDGATLAYARWLSELGGEVRTTAILPLRMLVVDREVAVVPVTADDSTPAAILLRSAGLIVGLCALFDAVWTSARPLYARARARDAQGLTNQERAILHLLSQGHTDDMIARRLAVSVRTCRRVIADLMERLTARSRFQAGAHAQAGGWLEVD
ncbi:MAG: helix-turn-helix transcriptional regulator [Actinobacteria bacterium 13_2_20CM_2_72_6]|nr:MAG: helix-turn-helix transcriptional regulator [Actinobacteria bacterium 13_2_20CM_2_72_6]